MKNINQPHTNRIPEPVSVIQKVFDFLLLFIPKILAKQVVAIMPLTADVQCPGLSNCPAHATGLSAGC